MTQKSKRGREKKRREPLSKKVCCEQWEGVEREAIKNDCVSVKTLPLQATENTAQTSIYLPVRAVWRQPVRSLSGDSAMPPKAMAFSLSLQLSPCACCPPGPRGCGSSSRHIIVLEKSWGKEKLKGRRVTSCIGPYFQESNASSDTPADPCF